MTDEELRRLEASIGGVCRCLKCCCKPGQGHNHPRWREYLQELALRTADEVV